MNHEENPQELCILRLFGVPAAPVQAAAQAMGLAVQCRTRGAETLAALRADTAEKLDAAKKALRGRFAAELYGEGETTLAGAAVQALEARHRLLVCSNAAAGALLETRLETVAAAEKIFDFGVMSYADAKVRARLDAAVRRVKGGAAAAELARVRAVQRLIGAELAAGCLERAEDTVLFVGSRKGCWVRTVANGDTPALWLLDMLRRAALSLPQAEGTSWQKYGRSIPPEVLTAQALPDRPTAAQRPRRRRGRWAAALVLLVLAAAAAAAWYCTGGNFAALPQLLQSLGAESVPHSGAELI